MLIKLPITKNNKIFFDSFSLILDNNKIILNTLDNNDFKKMICVNNNSYKSIDICFPLIFYIDKNIIFNELFFCFSLFYKKNNYNFIYLLEKFIKTNICSKYYFIQIKNIEKLYYIYNKVNYNIKDYNTLKELLHFTFYKLNYYYNISLCTIYLRYNNIEFNITKKLSNIINKIQNHKIYFYGIKDLVKNHIKYIDKTFNKIINDTDYFLSNNKKLLKIKILKNDNNFIYINTKKINKNKYEINKYPTKFNNYINIENIIYNITESLFYYSIADNVFKKTPKIINICNYFKNNSFNNIIVDKTLNYTDDLYIKLTNKYYYCYDEYDFEFFKNSINSEYNEDIYNILINEYIYPFCFNKYIFTENFKKIIYYFYKFNNEIQQMKGYFKLKIKYIHNSLLKLIENLKIKNNNITNYYKIYTDYIFINIFNIIIETNFLNLDKSYLTIIKNNYYTNMKGIILLHLLTWKNLNKKLNMYSYILNLKNQCNKLLFFENKININITKSDIDNKIKKVIIDPLYLYNFLKKEKDFIKWTLILKNNISLFYENNIKLENNDLKKIGKLIYILKKIDNQDIENKEYIEIIKKLKKYDYLLLFNDRINLRIKNILRHTKINLGFLAKHLILEYNTIDSLTSSSDNYDDINKKLTLMTKRYYKYKGKYIGLKMSELSSNINDINNISDTNDI
jgi:hypothetical protein